MKTDGQEMQHVPKERGRGLIFSLLQNPRTLRSVASINMKEEASIRPRTRRERKRRMRKLENETSFVNVDQGGIDDFSPHSSEFTLLYFGSTTTCRNTIRTIPITSKFVQRLHGCQSSTATNGLLQVIFVTCDKNPIIESSADLSHWYIYQADQPNFEILHQMLGVNTIPCIVVVNNSTGRVVTDYGLQSIENHFYGEPMEAIYAWRKNHSGLSVMNQVLEYCVLS